tara:strand:- start:604 stop:1326 length:723 start_codon:yes stop_codon:yes gene_type:complete
MVKTKDMVNKIKIKIYHDGPTLKEIKNPINKMISGYTFNPTLFRQIGIKNYLYGCKKILKITSPKDTSLEVIADDSKKMIDQGILLSKLSTNVSVKVPIIFTNGKSTKEVIKELVKRKIRLNITAIFSLKQIKEIMPIIKNTDTILSIFMGRIYDTGTNGDILSKKMSKYVKKNSKCKLLWASTRMSYDIIRAQENNFDIITMGTDAIKKIKNFNKTLNKASIDTVVNFYLDAKKSKYKI